MKNILLLTDFSVTAMDACKYALKIFEGQDAEFYLLNAYEMDFGGVPYAIHIKNELEDTSKIGLHNQLTELQVSYPNAKIHTKSSFGTLNQVVMDAIAEYEIDFVLMGGRDESTLEHFLLGSSAYELIKHINIPTFIVPTGVQCKSLEKVTFACDLHQLNLGILAPLKKNGKRF